MKFSIVHDSCICTEKPFRTNYVWVINNDVHAEMESYLLRMRIITALVPSYPPFTWVGMSKNRLFYSTNDLFVQSE